MNSIYQRLEWNPDSADSEVSFLSVNQHCLQTMNEPCLVVYGYITGMIKYLLEAYCLHSTMLGFINNKKSLSNT